jgi:hypothetical protein
MKKHVSVTHPELVCTDGEVLVLPGMISLTKSTLVVTSQYWLNGLLLTSPDPPLIHYIPSYLFISSKYFKSGLESYGFVCQQFNTRRNFHLECAKANELE